MCYFGVRPQQAYLIKLKLESETRTSFFIYTARDSLHLSNPIRRPSLPALSLAPPAKSVPLTVFRPAPPPLSQPAHPRISSLSRWSIQINLVFSKRAFKMVTRSVDLRSDTVTRPTDAMREAMASAEVDDDILGYDPTARHLEEEMAKMMGKEAALFVPSGTMGNLICVMVHCEVRGSEVILGDNSHIHVYENGGISTIGGVHPKTVKNEEDGTMELGAIEAAIRDPKGSTFYPSTMLICLENTHANSGGRCLSAEYTDSVGKIAKRHGLKLHIDGARLFNASIALGVPVHRLVEAADSVSVPSSLFLTSEKKV
ncbi:low-specificity L-threonine aldolase 1-like isoform X1 [Brassica napus]|uniref:low-specificity L-threonine aldolase 1-like isoform X1 n=1 Tax=Brassica napus TaxID=3708 RepID=UPI00207AB0A7|nr:low-specificity L-threonine aldolase 1-like isoform X1 [Brassica napus]